ncbi:MAG: hypothetical protein IKV38_01895, partial [Clostridia bacterium]|nr:hypothetical protein [Clostridia bacterium]
MSEEKTRAARPVRRPMKKKVCAFCAAKKESIDYKDIACAGDLDASAGFVAGFANAPTNLTFEDTYSSCQIVNLSNDALPSGVNGLYDNQLSLLRESAGNTGLKTMDLMRTDALSANFAITSTAYPALKAFYSDGWSTNAYAQEIVSVSVAAASFTDVDSTLRFEPTDMFARADYLTRDTYVDKTNTKGLAWSFNNTACKIYDAVPVSSYASGSHNSVGASTDLLRSRFVFLADVKGAILKAEMNGFYRQWHLTVDDQNVYYHSQSNENGTSNTPFLIDSKDELNMVRYYCLNTAATYKVTNDISSVTEFDPIVGFQGTFNGNNKTISGVVLADDRDGDMGLFADTRSGSKITNLILANITAVSRTDKTAGALIGSAVSTTISGILVSTETDGATVGGIVGKMNGGSLKLSGVTGLVGQTGTLLGGLVGETTGTVTVQNCYSTAVVLSNTSGSVAGGLIGKVTSGASVTKSYSAALADAATAKPLIGSGS